MRTTTARFSHASRVRATTSMSLESNVRVRTATPADVPIILEMIQELAEFEGEPTGPKLSVRDLIRDGFESSPAWFFVLIAECDGEVVGHALCNRAYSSWTCRAYYMEDLYVRPSARRRHVALHLLHELCQMGVREGVSRVDWHVLESNAPALALYARVGARDMRVTEGRAAMRLDQDRIQELARTKPSNQL